MLIMENLMKNADNKSPTRGNVEHHTGTILLYRI